MPFLCQAIFVLTASIIFAHFALIVAILIEKLLEMCPYYHQFAYSSSKIAYYKLCYNFEGFFAMGVEIYF